MSDFDIGLIIAQANLEDSKIERWKQKVRSTYLSHSMIEPFYRYKLRIISWQGWEAGNQTFSDEELEKVDVQEIQTLLDEDPKHEEAKS